MPLFRVNRHKIKGVRDVAVLASLPDCFANVRALPLASTVGLTEMESRVEDACLESHR